MILLLDTNIVSYFIKDHSLAQSYRPFLRGQLPAVSFATVGELYRGAYLAKWGPAKLARLKSHLDDYIVVESTREICLMWAQIQVWRSAQPIGMNDAWIAATALAYACPLATHNPNDFENIPNLEVLTA